MRFKRVVSGFICLSGVVLPLASTHAQTPPDAGSIQQQIERERKPALPPKATPEKPVEPEAIKPLEGLSFTVKSFHFAGNTLLSDETLASVLAGFLNRPLDFAELQKAAVAVANAYREAGWVVRAYLPQQDLVDGVVTIQVVEAVFGAVQFEGPPPERIKPDQIMGILTARQKAGEPINAEAINRTLLLADDLPGVALAGNLREGARPKESDLIVRLADEPLLAGNAALDNTGSRSTGSERLAANFRLSSPFKSGDLISANFLHTQGSDYLRLGGTLPLGTDGWRVGISTSYLSYKLVGADFAALNGKGSSRTVGLEASYPIIRSKLKNLYFNANVDNKSYDNQASGATTTKYKANTFTLGLAGNLFDNIGGGGANSASISLVDGTLNLDGSPNQAGDAVTTRAAGHYNKLSFYVSRQQVLTESTALFGALSGQYASKNLDSSEKFYLGGPAGVRAYPSSEGGGSNGNLINLELRHKLHNDLNLVAFYDYGHVLVNRNNSFTGAAALNDYSFRGAGLSLAWQSGKGLAITATYARRIGNNPNPTATGDDQDGSLVLDRFWLSASQQF